MIKLLLKEILKMDGINPDPKKLEIAVTKLEADLRSIKTDTPTRMGG